MALSAEDYLRQLQALLPRGPAWSGDEDSYITRLLSGLAEEFSRIDSRSHDLIAESDPRSTRELLSDWERVAGLPDKCSKGRATTVQERRDTLVAKLTMIGGASKAFFYALALQLGYRITIEEFRPFVCGLSRCGERLNGSASVRHVWRVRVHGPRTTRFMTGIGQCADKLLKISRAEDLECKFKTIKPAHTRLVFYYEGA